MMLDIREHSALLLSACLILTPIPALAATNSIDLLDEKMSAMVTVRAQTFNLEGPTQASPVMDPETGQIAVYTTKKVGYYEQTGAGVILNPRGVIATNTHIIYGSQRILAELRDGRQFEARVLFVSQESDFSLIQIDAGTLPYIEIAADIALGAEVTTIGNSPFLKGTFSGGRISGIGTREGTGGAETELLRLNINHYSGDSGGPVLDGSGRLVGIITAKSLTAQKELFAVSANKIYAAYLNLDPSSESR